MTRDEYLAQLRALLTGRTPPDELERIVAYYTEYFDEAGPAGEARVVQELGTPAELVGRILGANRVRETPAERTPPPRGSGHSSLWKVLLAICAAPIAIPLILLAAVMWPWTTWTRATGLAGRYWIFCVAQPNPMIHNWPPHAFSFPPASIRSASSTKLKP